VRRFEGEVDGHQVALRDELVECHVYVAPRLVKLVQPGLLPLAICIRRDELIDNLVILLVETAVPIAADNLLVLTSGQRELP
jgi:hypothetical protein